VQVLCERAATEAIQAPDDVNSGALGSLHASGVILGQVLAQLSGSGASGEAEMHAALSNILLLVKAAGQPRGEWVAGGSPGALAAQPHTDASSTSSPALVASAGAVAVLSRAAEERLVADLRAGMAAGADGTSPRRGSGAGASTGAGAHDHDDGGDGDAALLTPPSAER